MLCITKCIYFRPIGTDPIGIGVVVQISKGTLYETLSISDSFIEIQNIMNSHDIFRIPTEEFTDYMDILEEGV